MGYRTIPDQASSGTCRVCKGLVLNLTNSNSLTTSRATREFSWAVRQAFAGQVACRDEFVSFWMQIYLAASSSGGLLHLFLVELVNWCRETMSPPQIFRSRGDGWCFLWCKDVRWLLATTPFTQTQNEILDCNEWQKHGLMNCWEASFPV